MITQEKKVRRKHTPKFMSKANVNLFEYEGKSHFLNQIL